MAQMLDTQLGQAGLDSTELKTLTFSQERQGEPGQLIEILS